MVEFVTGKIVWKRSVANRSRAIRFSWQNWDTDTDIQYRISGQWPIYKHNT